ncbi:hypothetical protein HPB50_024032 [Hyalomma asiaticum]|uniref:Uncharacterized protein n=1 Tax=Hyalomma asiaticum TaxID=266040 RepID=A0ACB7SK18_HYAAI|nr:hypothetical protein HPB50_024032 [Hyalomma asiaticum]
MPPRVLPFPSVPCFPDRSAAGAAGAAAVRFFVVCYVGLTKATADRLASVRSLLLRLLLLAMARLALTAAAPQETAVGLLPAERGGVPSIMMCASRKAKVRALVAACLVVCAALVFFYHYSNDAGELSELHRKRLYGDQRRREDSSANFVDDRAQSKSSFTWPWAKRETLNAAGDCRALKLRRDVDIYTPDVYPTLNFKPQSRSYWNQTFENRYYETRKQWAKLPLERTASKRPLFLIEPSGPLRPAVRRCGDDARTEFPAVVGDTPPPPLA